MSDRPNGLALRYVGSQLEHVFAHAEVGLRLRKAQNGEAVVIQEVGRKARPTTDPFAGDDYIANGLAIWWSGEGLSRICKPRRGSSPRMAKGW